MQRGSRILDTACGTGDISIAMASYGYVIDAIDVSSDMLIIAKEKTHNKGLHINYILQDMTKINTNTKYDCITCINDGVNYLTHLSDIEEFFASSHLCLKQSGYLLFDISTEHKMEKMDGQMYAEELDELAFFWGNSYDAASHKLTMDISFFVKENGDIYKKTTEIHTQRAHSVDEISDLLVSCGYKIVATFDELSPSEPNANSDRIHFLCQKV